MLWILLLQLGECDAAEILVQNPVPPNQSQPWPVFPGNLGFGSDDFPAGRGMWPWDASSAFSSTPLSPRPGRFCTPREQRGCTPCQACPLQGTVTAWNRTSSVPSPFKAVLQTNTTNLLGICALRGTAWQVPAQVVARRNTVCDSHMWAALPPPQMSFWLSRWRERLGLEAQLVTGWCGESNTPSIHGETPQGALECVYGNQEEFAPLPGHGTRLGLELLILQVLRQCFSKFQMKKCNCQIPVCQKNLGQLYPGYKIIHYFCPLKKTGAQCALFMVSSATWALTIEKK